MHGFKWALLEAVKRKGVDGLRLESCSANTNTQCVSVSVPNITLPSLSLLFSFSQFAVGLSLEEIGGYVLLLTRMTSYNQTKHHPLNQAIVKSLSD